MVDRSFYIGKEMLIDSTAYFGKEVLDIGVARCTGVLADGSRFKFTGNSNSEQTRHYLNLGCISDRPRNRVLMEEQDIINLMRNREHQLEERVQKAPYYITNFGCMSVRTYKCEMTEDPYTGEKYWKIYDRNCTRIKQDLINNSYSNYYVSDSLEDTARYIANKRARFMIGVGNKINRPVNANLQPVVDYFKSEKCNIHCDERQLNILLSDNTNVQGNHFKVDYTQVHLGSQMLVPEVEKLESYVLSSEEAAKLCVDYIKDKYQFGEACQYQSNDIAETYTSVKNSDIVQIASYERLSL